jgi:hypothetical protein
MGGCVTFLSIDPTSQHMKNIMNLKSSSQTMRRGLCLGALLVSAAVASASTTLNFQVDMSVQLANGSFTPPPNGSDVVSVAGSFDGYNTTSFPLSNIGGTVWGTTVNDTSDPNPGQVQYKFVDTQSSWEPTLGNGNGNSANRVALLPATSGQTLNLPYCFFADAGTPVTSPITFQVDMAEQANLGAFIPGTGEVFCFGWFGGSGWSEGNLQLFPNTAAFVTNNGQVVSMPYTNTLTSAWGALGEVSNFKYVYNNETGNGDAYEGVASINQDSADGSGNRFVANVPNLVLPLVNFGDVAFSPVVRDTITFQVDMSVQVLTGNFVNGSSSVALLGDPSINNWSFTTCTEEAAPNTNVYDVVFTIVGAPGQQCQFKYFNQTTSTYENPSAANEYPGSANRFVTLPASGGTYAQTNYAFWGDLSINDVTPQASMVTFTVDMTPALNPNYTGNNGGPFNPAFGDTVWLNGINGGADGSYWGWSLLDAPPQYEMTQINDSALYTVTVPVNAGQAVNLAYKYGIDAADDEAPSNDNHNRYVRSFPNYAMPVDLFGGQGNGNATEPSLGNLSVNRSGNQVALSWLGRTTVQLRSTTSLKSPIVWTPLPLTDGANLVVTPGNLLPIPSGGVLGTNVSTSYTIGSGNLYFELIGPQ